ncbi:Dps family protein [Pedobacter sp.]|uniref:Dps family protein n=1 Tax=Pedobacter sp. TaxID=1411316 RepID=UPI003C6A41C8
MKAVKIGVKEESLEKVADCLAALLADEYILYTKTKKAHWNIEGLDFYSKHLLFEKQFGQLDEVIDELAERIRTVGHYVSASLKEFLELTHLTEKNNNQNDSKGFITELLEDHQSIIVKIRGILIAGEDSFLDLGTNDYITGLMSTHEKMAWMLKASLN